MEGKHENGGTVAQTCNPCYLGGRDQEDLGWRQNFILTNNWTWPDYGPKHK
jgi:hypothetical protein